MPVAHKNIPVRLPPETILQLTNSSTRAVGDRISVRQYLLQNRGKKVHIREIVDGPDRGQFLLHCESDFIQGSIVQPGVASS